MSKMFQSVWFWVVLGICLDFIVFCAAFVQGGLMLMTLVVAYGILSYYLGGYTMKLAYKRGISQVIEEIQSEISKQSR